MKLERNKCYEFSNCKGFIIRVISLVDGAELGRDKKSFSYAILVGGRAWRIDASICCGRVYAWAKRIPRRDFVPCSPVPQMEGCTIDALRDDKHAICVGDPGKEWRGDVIPPGPE